VAQAIVSVGICNSLDEAAVTGPPSGAVGIPHTFVATIAPLTATLPVTYTWQATGQTSQVHTNGGISDAAEFTWNVTGTQVVTVTAENCGGSDVATRTIVIGAEAQHHIYLPLVMRNSGASSK
jgi:hypothetical protein